MGAISRGNFPIVIHESTLPYPNVTQKVTAVMPGGCSCSRAYRRDRNPDFQRGTYVLSKGTTLLENESKVF